MEDSDSESAGRQTCNGQEKKKEVKKDNKVQKDKKRKRMASGITSSSEVEMSDNAEDDMADSIDTDALWEFIRENADKIAHQVLSSPNGREYTLRQDESIRALQEENQELKRRLEIAEGAITRCEKVIKRLEEKQTETITRSMRDNIIIKNLAEEQNESDAHIEAKVLNTIQSELRIPDAEMSQVVIERAHRSGKRLNDGNQARNIVVKLNSKGKSTVMRHIKNQSKTSHVKILEQYPPEVHANREKLWPVFVEAKRQGKTARWNVDRLQIDGKTISPPTDYNKDVNMDTAEEALKLKTKHTDVISKQNNHFQAHTVGIKSSDQVVPAVKALCADFRIAGASHVAYAYRLGREEYAITNWEDDGHWGAGKRIMDAITSSNQYNILVCVTHWHAGNHMGPGRFDIIRELANKAITLR
jgi:hypothetical protein